MPHVILTIKQVLKYHHQHLSITKESGDKAAEGSAYFNLRIAYHGLNEFNKAIK